VVSEPSLPPVKPHLRGWLHLGTFPFALAAGALLTLLAPAGRYRTAVAVFAVTAALLFGVSALYHRGHWGPRAFGVLKRLDHANIFLIIAGTYTPFAVVLLPDGPARRLLWIVWSGAVAGVAFRVLWVGAPRWLYVPVYGLRRPDPSPRWFGFHEVFHALTVVAFGAHCAGLALAVRPA
jgi:hemolysin III